MDNVDFKIFQISFNAVKEELENIDACLDLNYSSFTDVQCEVLEEMFSSVLNVRKRIDSTLNSDLKE